MNRLPGLAADPRLVIVGACVGGLAAALALHSAGFRRLTIYESSHAVQELGVGINVLPHAVRGLSEMGLLDQLLTAGVATAELRYYTRQGQLIWQEPRGLAAGFRWPQIAMNRAQLLGVLHRAVCQRLGAQHIR